MIDDSGGGWRVAEVKRYEAIIGRKLIRIYRPKATSVLSHALQIDAMRESGAALLAAFIVK
ncbi:hypothetical protein [Burkholderia lata]|uniref:hypothetical protein n=1 Tax=Burkholderia lata (strain ATCC 17760 / DSM 23089 / LMG 22485 / NCIMB 9086 / R18194 / 383) TaxID=482957 RepID=UPI00158215F9|nr:hypothetical protein [Burkholderia lata]